MANPFFTIGHSTRTIDAFVGLLREAQVRMVIDVRTVPKSRTNPQYNEDTLPATLSAFAIGYDHMAALGGLRGRTPGVSAETNASWENQSFHNYADYATTDAFRAGLDQLRRQGHERRCAIMCAEAVWWRCHRRIIADYLIAAGESVFHIMGPHNMPAAKRTPSAQMTPAGALHYPG
jgi:uncharacterized protein (DUF488 family)